MGLIHDEQIGNGIIKATPEEVLCYLICYGFADIQWTKDGDIEVVPRTNETYEKEKNEERDYKVNAKGLIQHINSVFYDEYKNGADIEAIAKLYGLPELVIRKGIQKEKIRLSEDAQND